MSGRRSPRRPNLVETISPLVLGLISGGIGLPSLKVSVIMIGSDKISTEISISGSSSSLTGGKRGS